MIFLEQAQDIIQGVHRYIFFPLRAFAGQIICFAVLILFIAVLLWKLVLDYSQEYSGEIRVLMSRFGTRAYIEPNINLSSGAQSLLPFFQMPSR